MLADNRASGIALALTAVHMKAWLILKWCLTSFWKGLDCMVPVVIRGLDPVIWDILSICVQNEMVFCRALSLNWQSRKNMIKLIIFIGLLAKIWTSVLAHPLFPCVLKIHTPALLWTRYNRTNRQTVKPNFPQALSCMTEHPGKNFHNSALGLVPGDMRGNGKQIWSLFLFLDNFNSWKHSLCPLIQVFLCWSHFLLYSR